ncbi:unnamed protein product [Effrenium voratum]|nr:unnamed protein product [Effrenium voratum]
MRPLLALLLACAGALRPCADTIRGNCTARFAPCGAAAFGGARLGAREASRCHKAERGRLQRDEQVLVQFTDGSPELGGNCTEILLWVGECWGLDPDGDSYDCLGRCGVGCQEEGPGLCSNWAKSCLKHDVCSYFYNAKGGAADVHCGWAFNLAAPDFVRPCLTDATCALRGFNTKAEVCGASPPAAHQV